MIKDFTEGQFVQVLQNHLSPTSPIQSQEYLYGRDVQVRQIQQALYAPGRSIFIHGDRGVGKTSLAQTVAFAHQSAIGNPIFVACTPSTTFGKLIADVINAIEKPQTSDVKSIHKAKFNTAVAGYEFERSRSTEARAQRESLELNEAMALLSAVDQTQDKVVVIDEFDRIRTQAERTKFADFIKQIGDQRISVRFIFCGVAEALDKLLGTHESCYRYLASIALPRLGFEARWEIIDKTAQALNVVIDDRPRYRIATISDGFPHYVHLVCEKLFWQMFDDENLCIKPSMDHYMEAVSESVLGIEQHLSRTYDEATMKDTDGYEEVLWAAADHADLIRSSNDIYESYVRLMERADAEPLEKSVVSSRLQSLKGASCASILASDRPGWYFFKESIMRGYVRLRAEEQGLELALDYAASKVQPVTWRQRSARRGRVGTSAPSWRRLKDS